MHRNIHITVLNADTAKTLTNQINQQTMETGYLARHDGDQVMIFAANPMLEDIMAAISRLTGLFHHQRKQVASPAVNDMPGSVSHG